jgi:hypothetical protein
MAPAAASRCVGGCFDRTIREGLEVVACGLSLCRHCQIELVADEDFKWAKLSRLVSANVAVGRRHRAKLPTLDAQFAKGEGLQEICDTGEQSAGAAIALCKEARTGHDQFDVKHAVAKAAEPILRKSLASF